MIDSKPWEWNKLSEKGKNKWKEPCIESYYLINRWKEQNKRDFLDIGCGLGRHTIQFAKQGFNTNAIDLSEEAVQSTKEWLEKEGLKTKVKVQKADMVNLHFEPESMDCILCRNVIAHTDTEGIKRIIEQIYKILRKDGECFLTLGSKNASTFKDKKNPKKDENTAIRMDEGPEKGVPHFYADMEIIPELFKDFSIEYLAQVQDLEEKEYKKYKSYWHYILLIRK